MISLQEAQSYVDGLATPLSARSVPVGASTGMVLAHDVVSTVSVPTFDNSAMDGFAVRSADGTADRVIVGTQYAGLDRGLVVGPGEAVRIMTGAPMPAGADAIVVVERAEVVVSPDGVETLRHGESLEPGQFVRRAGEDVAPGDVVLPHATVITPAAVGVLASLGLTNVEVIARPRVGVFSTGDELVSDGSDLAAGQIRDSNRPTLLAVVSRLGYEAIDLGCVPDDEDQITAALVDGAAACDVLLTSGGVSMGDADMIKRVMRSMADMRWMQVAIRPAKPLAAGLIGTTPIVGLPGNPVSALLSFELFARRVIERRAGISKDRSLWFSAVVPDGLARRPDGKIHFPRVVVTSVDGAVVARPAGAQGSHQLAASAAANAIAWLPDGDGVAPGGSVAVALLS